MITLNYVIPCNMLILFNFSYVAAPYRHSKGDYVWSVAIIHLPHQHMLKIFLTFIKQEPMMMITFIATMIPVTLTITSMDSVHSQVLQAGINWWSSPKAWESSIDSSGYLKEKAVPLIIKMADELSRRSKNNGNVSSDNQNILSEGHFLRNLSFKFSVRTKF